MKFYLVFFNLLFFISISLSSAQEIKDSLDKGYGLDPTLYNGNIYSFYPSSEISGHQFFSSPDFSKGELTIKTIKYGNVNLNYDVYNQEIILKYFNTYNGISLISISQAWLEEFKFENKEFKLIQTDQASPKIFQVIGTGSMQILYRWTKKMIIERSYGRKSYYVFMPAKKEMYVTINSQLMKFRNNRSFVLLFSPDKQILIKKYLKQNSIKVKNAEDEIMIELTNYCNSL